MTDFIRRLEDATEGSRELDAEIARAVGIRVVGDFDDDGNGEFYDWPERRNEGADPGPSGIIQEYTTSLDDALKLVPEGYSPGIDPIFFVDGEFVRFDAILCKPHWADWMPTGSEWIERIKGRGKTPALALCAASLKARQL